MAQGEGVPRRSHGKNVCLRVEKLWAHIQEHTFFLFFLFLTHLFLAFKYWKKNHFRFITLQCPGWQSALSASWFCLGESVSSSLCYSVCAAITKHLNLCNITNNRDLLLTVLQLENPRSRSWCIYVWAELIPLLLKWLLIAASLEETGCCVLS